MVYSTRIGLCWTIAACEVNKEDKTLVVHVKRRRHLFNWEKKFKGSMILFERSKNRKMFQPKEHLKKGYPPTHFMRFKINLFN
jgi:hypothetical protein